MASPKTRKLWEDGVPLNEAWIHFSGSKLRDEFEALPEFWTGLADDVQRDSGSVPNAFGTILTAAHAAMLRRSNIEQTMKAQFRDDLFNARIIAAGYQHSPPGKSPVLIDADHFDSEADFDWKSGRVTANGHSWNRVHVSLALPTNSQPSSATLIRNAISELADQDSRIRSLGRKQQRQLVVEKLGRDYSPGNGLSSQNIDKHLFELLGPKRLI